MNGEVLTLDPYTNCAVCLRAYGDMRGRIPRLLPCFHTYCERCIWKQTRWNHVRCPECETRHPTVGAGAAGPGAVGGGGSPEGFPVNLQVLEHIGRLLQRGYQPVEPTTPATPTSAHTQPAHDNSFWADDIEYDPPPKLTAQRIRDAIQDKPWVSQMALQKTSPNKVKSPTKGTGSHKLQQLPSGGGGVATSTPVTPQNKTQTMDSRMQSQMAKVSPVTPAKVQTPSQFTPDKVPEIRILSDSDEEFKELERQYREEEEEGGHYDVYQDIDEIQMSGYLNNHKNHPPSGYVPDSRAPNSKTQNHGFNQNVPQQNTANTSFPQHQNEGVLQGTNSLPFSSYTTDTRPRNQYRVDAQIHQQKTSNSRAAVLPDQEPSGINDSTNLEGQNPGQQNNVGQNVGHQTQLNHQNLVHQNYVDLQNPGHVSQVIRQNPGHQNHVNHQNLGHENHMDHGSGQIPDNIPSAEMSNVSRTVIPRGDNKENIPRAAQNQVTGPQIVRKPQNVGHQNMSHTQQNTKPKTTPAKNETMETGPGSVNNSSNNKPGLSLLNKSGEVTVLRPPRFLADEKPPVKVQWGKSKQQQHKSDDVTKPPTPTKRTSLTKASPPTKALTPTPATKRPEVRKAKSEELLRRPKKVQPREAREAGDNPEHVREDMFMEQLLRDATSGAERDGKVWSDRVGVIRKPKRKTKSPDVSQGNISQGSRSRSGEIPAYRKQQEIPSDLSWKGPASRFKCRVVWSVELKYSDAWHLCVMSGGDGAGDDGGGDSAVVCGERDGWCRLTRYSLRDGQTLGRLRMEQADGLTEIQHNGRNYLAVAYSKDHVIELYNVRDMRRAVHTYHVDPDRPGSLCSSSPYTLLYADTSRYVKPQDVTSLDCRASRPVYKGTTHTRYPSNSDMCCVRDGDRSLLVTSYGHHGDEESGIYAYNRRTDRLEWSVRGLLRGMERPMFPRGVTTDGPRDGGAQGGGRGRGGHLFVCDPNNACVQMFSGGDGVYLGPVLRCSPRGNGLYEPALVRWCDRLSALVLVHRDRDRDQTWMSLVHVQQPH